LDAEDAHRLAIQGLKLLPPVKPRPDDGKLAVRAFGLNFPNPVGMAAGFDKNAEAPDALLRLGFGFVEVGTVTPRPQPGNPRPRLFRLVEDAALINRLGFNSAGLPAAVTRLAARRGQGGLVGANIGKNRDTLDDIADYVQGVTALAPYADYLVVNVSSPNTPGLRALQRKSVVVTLIERLMAARASVSPDHPPPLLLKIAPDLTPEERADLAAAALATRIDGMVIANTTVARPPTLASAQAHEPGGLSGKPLFAPSTALLAEMYRLTEGKLPLIGVGGIASGADVYEKIRAGASLVQLYTALVYQGPGLVQRIKEELAALLARDGFASVGAAVGSAAHSPRAPAHGR
ncbi:MAG TPA: quinone-dependent dihydroorotate dehydrogenase, partial [Stellaceae bacterium]|nr:quinone-dependent dihydroorotate dehydrogenase [Stellaceae bacterium]